MSQSFSLDQLTESQREAVEHKYGPLLIIAGPGSGTTRTIICRIARLIEKGVRPYNICAITFTNKAAEEMKNRVAQMGVPRGTQVSTFHSLCVRILRQYAEYADIDPNFSIYSDSEQKSCIKEIIKASNQSSQNFPPAKVLSYISNYKNDLFEPDEAISMASGFQQNMVAKMYQRYQNKLKANNALDFDDLLTKVAFLIRDYPDIRRQLSDRFKYVLVDEYQDTNHAQYQIAKGLAMDHGNFCVTGDPDQSIYKWRGADIRNIMAFEKDWPTAKVVKLEENFRSCPSILALADKLISHNKQRKDKRLIPVRKEQKDVQFNSYDDDRTESREIAQDILKCIADGCDPNEIAVLYRTNSMSRSIEEAFVRARVPYIVVRGVEFYNRKEIKDMLAYLKLISNPSDNVAFERIVNTPTRGIGKTTVDKLKLNAISENKSIWDVACNVDAVFGLSNSAMAKVAIFVDMIKKFMKLTQAQDFSVANLLEKIYENTGMHSSLKNAKESQEDAMDNIEELINSAGFYDSQDRETPATLEDYLQMISLYSDSDAYDPESGRVSLMTLHASKGLEFNNVYIIGLEQGILPHERSIEDESEMEEERRLFFVGITRARLNLSISRTKYRTIRGQETRTMPSRFIFEAGLSTETYATSGSSDSDCNYSNSPNTSSYSSSPRKPRVSTSNAEFRAGEVVKHSKFGIGKVKEYIELGENSVITVAFKSGQTKTLVKKYAKLEKI